MISPFLCKAYGSKILYELYSSLVDTRCYKKPPMKSCAEPCGKLGMAARAKPNTKHCWKHCGIPDETARLNKDPNSTCCQLV